MAVCMNVETWRDLLSRLRYKDLGAGATFGHRDVAMLEGFEVCRHRPSNGGPPVLHRAAALLFELGVRVDMPTHEAAKLLRDSGYGAPYGRGPCDPEIWQRALRAAKG